ncbi:hypothetical protein DIPPA_23422 [Diplonema papillatum]|nr:hypothetical protein DIPPA_23422 [Diplonema papillatum]
MLLRTQTLVLLASLAAASVVEITDDNSMRLLHRILRSTDAVSTLMIYDSTTPKGAYDREVYGEICPGVTLYADCYALDASEPSLRWVATAYAPNATSTPTILLFSPTLKPAGKAEGDMPRPQGVKTPAVFALQLTAVHFKAWVQRLMPTARNMAKGKVDRAADVAALLEKNHLLDDDHVLVFITDKDTITPALSAVALRCAGHCAVVYASTKAAASAFDLEKLPAMVVYRKGERIGAFKGKMEGPAVDAFLGKPGMAERIDASIAEDDRETKLLAQKEVAPAPEITTQEQWDTQVMDPAAGLVAVAFLDPLSESFSSLKQVLRDLTRARTAVKAAY